MEYVIFIILTFLSIWSIIRITKRGVSKRIDKVMFTQSVMHCMLISYSPNRQLNKQKIVSQLDKHIKKAAVKIIVTNGKAYWVSDNIFYVAEISDGNIVSDTAQQVDTLNMSKEELDKMIEILDNLENDR